MNLSGRDPWSPPLEGSDPPAHMLTRGALSASDSRLGTEQIGLNSSAAHFK